MQNFNLNEQYEKKQQVSMEIPIIIKHIKINKSKDESEQQNHFEEINKQLNMFLTI